MKKRSIAILLALVLSLSLFTACGKTATEPEETAAAETDAAETETTGEDTNSDVDSIMADSMEKAIYERYSNIYAKHEPDEVVMTINGEPVTWEDYFFWFYSECYRYEIYYSPSDWTTVADGADASYEDYVKTAIESYAKQFWVVEQEAEKLGIELTDEDLAAIEQAKKDDCEEVSEGDEEAFAEQKRKMFLTDELYDRLMTVAQYSTRIFSDRFGENGSKLSGEDTLAYAIDKGFIHVKHILVLVDSDATDEEKAEKLQQAEDILAQLKAVPAAELETKFDELMNEYSEDPGLASYPDGYYFTTGQMYQEFEDASVALEENAVSEIVESQSGYHIILRLPINADDIYVGEYTLRYVAASELYSNMLADWLESADVEYTELGESIDLNDLFGFVPTESTETETSTSAEAE